MPVNPPGAVDTTSKMDLGALRVGCLPSEAIFNVSMSEEEFKSYFVCPQCHSHNELRYRVGSEGSIFGYHQQYRLEVSKLVCRIGGNKGSLKDCSSHQPQGYFLATLVSQFCVVHPICLKISSCATCVRGSYSP
ncbi:hypothetical protein SLA2020_510990 [Shorea laevis]